MIVGLGVDLFDVPRLEAEVRAAGADLLSDIFTPGEIAACRRDRRPGVGYALRFAAKEALVKALGAAAAEGVGLPWRHVHVRLGGAGRHAVVLLGPLKALAARRGVGRILLSVTHARGLAAAFVVLESTP